jgi:hypothetical protein
MTSVLGMPEPVVAGLRDAPFWAAMEAEAHGPVADHALVGDLAFRPAGQLRAIEVPTLVLDGGQVSPLAPAAVQVARGIPARVTSPSTASRTTSTTPPWPQPSPN